MPGNLICICQVLRRIPIPHLKFYVIKYSLEKSTWFPFIRIPAVLSGGVEEIQKKKRGGGVINVNVHLVHLSLLFPAVPLKLCVLFL